MMEVKGGVAVVVVVEVAVVVAESNGDKTQGKPAAKGGFPLKGVYIMCPKYIYACKRVLVSKAFPLSIHFKPYTTEYACTQNNILSLHQPAFPALTRRRP